MLVKRFAQALSVMRTAASLKAELQQRRDARITWIAEVNEDRKQDKAVKHTGDFRNVLDDPAVDAVVINTGPLARSGSDFACEAGKHVYVEKPCSLRFAKADYEEAAKRNKTVNQHGMQVRSTDMAIEAIERREVESLVM